MRVLILGAYGMLGHKLAQRLSADFEVSATCRQRQPAWDALLGSRVTLIEGVTVENFDSVVEAVAQARPEVVINCIGVIKQQAKAKQALPSISINALFPHQLAALGRAARFRLIHFSTDCVFSGRQGHYRQEDVPDPVDLYGRSKLLGEVSDPGCLTIRSSIIGRELGSAHGLLEWFLRQHGQRIRGFQKAIYSGFSTLEMSRIVALVLTRFPNLDGVWQVASQPISKYDLLNLIKRRLSLDVQIDPDRDFVCDRSLDGSRFAQATGYRAPEWAVMVDEMVADFAAEAP